MRFDARFLSLIIAVAIVSVAAAALSADPAASAPAPRPHIDVGASDAVPVAMRRGGHNRQAANTTRSRRDGAHKPRKDAANTTPDKPRDPPSENPRKPRHDHASHDKPKPDKPRAGLEPRPPRLVCIGGRITGGACRCASGSTRKVAGVQKFICASVVARPIRAPDGTTTGPTADGSRQNRAPVAVAAAVAAVAATATATAAGAAPDRRAPRDEPSAGRGPSGETPAGETAEAMPDELVLSVDSMAPRSVEASLARRFKLEILERTTLRLIHRRIVRLRIPDRRTVPTVIAAIAADPSLAPAQPNYIYRQQQSIAEPAPRPAQYALAKIALDPEHRVATGRGAVVAIIDTGIDTTHPDLTGADIEVFDALPEDKQGERSHGTAIAGIMAARGTTSGVAPDARFVDIRAFGGTGSGGKSTTYALLRGIEKAVALEARVLNMSFAGPADPLLLALVSAAAEKDVIMVAAAGNGGRNAAPAYPAAYPDVIAVSATDADDRLYDRSNTGSYIMIAAPGVDVLVPTAGRAHDFKSGTSIAAAHVSGIIALMLEQNPRLSARAARRNLAAGAVDLGLPGRDDEFGAGRANAAATLRQGVAQAP